MVASFGEELRREREPGGVYNKGIVRAYCKHVGLDVESMVDAFMAHERSSGDPQVAPDGLLRRSEPKAARREAVARPSRAWIGGLAVVVASAVVTAAYFLYT